VRIDNQPRFVKRAKGVVLATGGFVMNEEMRRKYCPETFKLTTPIGDKDDGVGIMLGLGAGGDAVHMEQFFTTCPWTMPESHAKGVFVNAAGQRFINEDCYHGRVSPLRGRSAWRQGLSAARQRAFRPADGFRADDHRGHRRQLGRGRGRTRHGGGHAQRHHGLLQPHAHEGRDPLFDKQVPILTPLDQGPFIALELNFADELFQLLHAGRAQNLRSCRSAGPDGRAHPRPVRGRALHVRAAGLGPWLFVGHEPCRLHLLSGGRPARERRRDERVQGHRAAQEAGWPQPGGLHCLL
jgi:3-oxo-5alpha-steroid 4-dehydrogenase